MRTPGGRERKLPWSVASIRLRLLGGLLVLLVIGLLSSILTTSLLLRGFLDQRYRDSLEVSVTRMREVLAQGPQEVNADQLSILLGPPMGIVVLDTTGKMAMTTGAGDGIDPAFVRFTATVPSGTVADSGEVAGAQDLLAVRLPSPGATVVGAGKGSVEAGEVILVVDTSIDNSTVRTLVLRLTQIVTATLVLLAALALAVLRVGLGPLRRMATAADAIAAGSLGERLPVGGRRTETDVLAQAVNNAFDAQAHAEATARTFAADASHELRTPLATVSGWLDLYHQGSLEGQDVDRAIEHIDAEVGRMRLIVDELGLLARLDAGRPLERADLDLAGLAASVVEDAGVIHPEREITLSAPDRVPAVGDGSRLEQVLRNLVGNAVQHTPAGTAVHVTARTEGDSAVVTVVDDGPGIDAEHLPRLFERFWRAEASRSRDYGGSGLGLAIVKAIVHAHDGTVAVDSTVGVGTTVTVRLPTGPGGEPA